MVSEEGGEGFSKEEWRRRRIKNMEIEEWFYNMTVTLKGMFGTNGCSNKLVLERIKGNPSSRQILI